MSRTGGSAGALLVMAGVLGALPPVGYLERFGGGAMSNKTFDPIKVVVMYMRILAWSSIATIPLSLIFARGTHIDFTWILLFWGAAALNRRTDLARRSTLFFWWLVAGLGVLAVVVASVFGTSRMSVSFFGRDVSQPSVIQVICIASALCVLALAPILLLSSRRAKEMTRKDAEPSAGGNAAAPRDSA